MKNRNPINYMVHDLKTPINSIKELIGVIKDVKNFDEIEQCVDIIDSNVSYLDVLVQQVLDLARIEEDKLVKYQKHFTLTGLMNECNKIIKIQIEKKKIQCICNVDVKHNYVRGDYLHTLQILINILSNSIKFSKIGGKIIITVDEISSGLYLFQIIDNGCGMSGKFQKKAFEPYAQENPNLGNGLGLTITKKLVGLLDGTIEFESAKDVGTSFMVKLPFEIVKKQIDYDISDTRILLIDDNEITQTITSMLLKDNLAVVDIAFNGVEAIKMFNENYYDIIILDVFMPILSGYEVLIALKNNERYQNRKIPIIAMTANDNVEELKEFDDFLIKPVKKDELFQMIKKHKV